MTEVNQVHSVASKHLTPFGRFERVDNPLVDGFPDVYYNLFGVTGWVEEKLIPLSGKPPDHFTLDQLLWGERETSLGGRWFLLGKCGSNWVLYDAPGARAWRDGLADRWLFRIGGRFPLREVLDRLAPRSARGVTFYPLKAI